MEDHPVQAALFEASAGFARPANSSTQDTFFEGVNASRLLRCLARHGCAAENSLEAMASPTVMADHVNRLTRALDCSEAGVECSAAATATEGDRAPEPDWRQALEELLSFAEVNIAPLTSGSFMVSVCPKGHAPLWWYATGGIDQAVLQARSKSVALRFLTA